MIKRKGTLLSSVAVLGTAMLLTACGGDGGDSPVDDFGSNPGEGDNQALLYAYPDNGQGEISTAAPVVLRFSSAVNLGQAQNSITLYEGDAETGTVVNTTPESVAKEPNNVLLQPDEDLKPNQTYTVVIEDLRLRKGTAKDQTLTFTTRPLHEGPKNLVVKDDAFEVSRRMPDGSAMEPVMDFSSFRFQFTQPVDRATANYGEEPASTGPGGGTIPADSVVLRDSSGAPVPATLLIDGAYMTVDPDVEYLNAGETYTLDITADLASTYGETFGAESYTFTPKDSSPGREPAILVQKLTQGNTSRLTGKPINQVPVNGTLLGENKNITQASAEVVRAELADVTTYTDVTPIRLPKGTVLNGAEINPILIGGEVPAGFGSGDVTMTVLSDASGYLVPNPYAENNPDALRIVHLLMDVGIATSEARANGAFTQDLLHIELVGLAEVDPAAGVLNLDAVSMVEPNILGQEYGYGMLSFQLQSYKDQNNPPVLVDDIVPPSIQSATVGAYTDPSSDIQRNKEELLSLDDPIVINFDEPINAESVEGRIKLYRNGMSSDINYHVDGAAVVVQPKERLDINFQGSEVEYRIVLDAGIEDLSGNASLSAVDETLSTPLFVEDFTVAQPGGSGAGIPLTVDEFRDMPRSPIILAAYPGYPCRLDSAATNLSSGVAGICAGGFPGYDQGTSFDMKSPDDLLPVQDLPSNRPIVVMLSKPVDPNSIALGSNFVVQEIDVDGSVVSDVAGQVGVTSKTITFYPETPWEQGALYQYTLVSNGDSTSGAAVCDGTGAICGSSHALPIQTQVLGDISIVDTLNSSGGEIYPPERETQVFRSFIPPNGGGDNFVQFFKGASSSDNVLQVLSTKPVSDANANLFFDATNAVDGFPPFTYLNGVYTYTDEEQGVSGVPDPNADQGLDPGGVLPSPNSVKILSRARTGLGVEPSPVINGGNVGCGYQAFIPNPEKPGAFTPIPLECPEDKFSYLTSSIVAEITTEYVDGEGLKVLIWPSQILGTSINLFARFLEIPSHLNAGSGPQFLRMRYAEDELGYRSQPIEGWITSGTDGQLSLEASIDLYVDAPYVPLFGAPFDNPTHNFISYPITMNVSGPISFLDDGRMYIDQFNTNAVDLELRVNIQDGSWGGSEMLTIPERGNHLRYISESIK
ncbi:MAG: Ig-like domain-containing protein [Alloalcanivorax venustensis]